VFGAEEELIRVDEQALNNHPGKSSGSHLSIPSLPALSSALDASLSVLSSLHFAPSGVRVDDHREQQVESLAMTTRREGEEDLQA
jgi:hypothetical protein